MFALDSHNNTIRKFTKDESFVPNSLDNALDHKYTNETEMFSMSRFVQGQPQEKKQKTTDLRPVVLVNFNTRRGKVKPIQLRALLDSGGSGCLITQKFTKKLKLREIKGKATVWNTPAGTLTTKGKVRSQFVLPELHDNRVIEWDFHVTPHIATYDMIIGRDMLQDLGIDI